MNDPHTWTTVWGLTMGADGGMGSRGQSGKNWDSCNRITIKKDLIKKKTIKRFFKLWYIYTMEYYTAERKKELLPFMTEWMELESMMLSEMSQSMKDRYGMILLITGI